GRARVRGAVAARPGRVGRRVPRIRRGARWTGPGSAMTWRSVVGDVLTRVPWAPGLTVRVWGELCLRDPAREHPLFSRVKSRLGYRMRKRVPLVTGQWIEV